MAETAPDTRAVRLTSAISASFELFCSVADGASFEERAGHSRMTFPAVPLPLFNSVIVRSFPCAGLADSIHETEAAGLPCGVQLQPGADSTVDAEVAALGFTTQEPMPGMTVTPAELQEDRRDRQDRQDNLEIVRAATAADLDDAVLTCERGFGAPPGSMRPLYPERVLEGDDVLVYLGRVGGVTVTTAISCRTGREVAVFSVATPAEHRRRGYGGAVTGQAMREGFQHGADLGWLQTTELGEPVYRRLGFRHTTSHVLLSRTE